MAKIIRTQKEFTKWFNWDDDGKCKILVRYISEEQKSKIYRNSKTVRYERHQRIEDVDIERFSRNFIEETVLDIKGLTGKFLLQMVDPTKVDIEGNIDEEIPFSDEVKAVLRDFPSTEFVNFITYAATKIEEFQAGKEIKN